MPLNRCFAYYRFEDADCKYEYKYLLLQPTPPRTVLSDYAEFADAGFPPILAFISNIVGTSDVSSFNPQVCMHALYEVLYIVQRQKGNPRFRPEAVVISGGVLGRCREAGYTKARLTKLQHSVAPGWKLSTRPAGLSQPRTNRW